jgi:8-oxo-dGTP diphosphatase
MKKEALPVDKNNWLLQRFVSIGYYALVEFSQVTPTPDELSSNCDWYDLQTIPPLMMDHTHILNKALETLQQHINRQPIGYNLLPLKFTMPELQKLYEAILGKQLDRRNFQRKILSYGILKKLKEVKTGVAHKAPFLYSFDLKKYNEALKNGLGGGW